MSVNAAQISFAELEAVFADLEAAETDHLKMLARMIRLELERRGRKPKAAAKVT